MAAPFPGMALIDVNFANRLVDLVIRNVKDYSYDLKVDPLPLPALSRDYFASGAGARLPRGNLSLQGSVLLQGNVSLDNAQINGLTDLKRNGTVHGFEKSGDLREITAKLYVADLKTTGQTAMSANGFNYRYPISSRFNIGYRGTYPVEIEIIISYNRMTKSASLTSYRLTELREFVLQITGNISGNTKKTFDNIGKEVGELLKRTIEIQLQEALRRSVRSTDYNALY